MNEHDFRTEMERLQAQREKKRKHESCLAILAFLGVVCLFLWGALDAILTTVAKLKFIFQ